MSAAGKPGAVFDCMTYLQAAVSPHGPAAECLRLFERGAFLLYVSSDVLEELRDVLARPRVRRKNPHITDEAVGALLERLASSAVLLEGVAAVFSYPRDPKDEPYVNLAVAAGARYLVTCDNDLLDLMREDYPDGENFRRRFPGLAILDPVAFLREIRAAEPASEEPTP